MTEVMRLKLDSDVAVLTACETGNGKLISGEGVMGLARAFQYAGSKSVLASLWNVAEEPSEMLVESFFHHIKEGNNLVTSLRYARRDIRNAGYVDPYFWAPFILIGEDAN